MDTIVIHSDGSCYPNPGFGGYGAVIIHPDKKEDYISNGEKNTTNNRMELIAAIVPMNRFKEKRNIILYSDSQYVVNGINKWLEGWKRKNKVMKNMDLWNKIYALKNLHNIKARWVKGHSGDRYNELADMLSTEGRLKVMNNNKI